MACYRFQEIKYKNPIFKGIDATYIIHLEGNGRLPAIQEQLKNYHLTETVYILFNKGFKTCKKDEYINKSYLDIVDAYFHCFKDANNKKFNHVLILEDDFMFDKQILDPYHAESIECFLNSKIGDNFVYHLGTIPLIQFELYGEHNRIFLGGGAHSCIYTKPFINHLINNIPKESINDWDVYLNTNCTRFKYKYQLCYQLFTATENQLNWGIPNSNNNIIIAKFNTIYINIVKYIINKLELDTTPEYGFKLFDSISKKIFWIILISYCLISLLQHYYVINNFKFLVKKWHHFVYLFIGINIIYPIILIFILLVIIYYNICIK